MSTTHTCSFCAENKIRRYKPHSYSECPIRAAAYCSHCASYGLHFMKDCPNTPPRRHHKHPIYQGTPAPEPSKALFINDDMDCVYSYLKLWGQDVRPKGYADKTVKKILAGEAPKHGYDGVIYI